jgi:hypothetical protein
MTDTETASAAMPDEQHDRGGLSRRKVVGGLAAGVGAAAVGALAAGCDSKGGNQAGGEAYAPLGLTPSARPRISTIR